MEARRCQCDSFFLLHSEKDYNNYFSKHAVVSATHSRAASVDGGLRRILVALLALSLGVLDRSSLL
jgi:hypothetical protein